jgi:hypothetical protein
VDISCSSVQPEEKLNTSAAEHRRGQWIELMFKRAIFEFFKCDAIIVGLPLASGLVAHDVWFWFSDRDLGGAHSATIAGIAVAAFAFIVAVVIVRRRVAAFDHGD